MYEDPASQSVGSTHNRGRLFAFPVIGAVLLSLVIVTLVLWLTVKKPGEDTVAVIATPVVTETPDYSENFDKPLTTRDIADKWNRSSYNYSEVEYLVFSPKALNEQEVLQKVAVAATQNNWSDLPANVLILNRMDTRELERAQVTTIREWVASLRSEGTVAGVLPEGVTPVFGTNSTLFTYPEKNGQVAVFLVNHTTFPNQVYAGNYASSTPSLSATEGIASLILSM